MGSRCIPNYANIFMNKIEKKALNAGTNFEEGVYPILLFKHFLDDIFIIWMGSVEILKKFLTQLNTIHPTIQFTANYCCPFMCEITGPHNCYCHQSR